MYEEETKKLFQYSKYLDKPCKPCAYSPQPQYINNNCPSNNLGPMTFQDPLSYNHFDNATSDNELNDPESSYGKVDEDQLLYEYSSE